MKKIVSLLIFLTVSLFCDNKIILSNVLYSQDNIYVDQDNFDMKIVSKLINNAQRSVLSRVYKNYKVVNDIDIYKNYKINPISLNRNVKKIPKNLFSHKVESLDNKSINKKIDYISDDYPFVILIPQIIHLSKSFNLVVSYSLIYNDNIYDLGNVKIVKNDIKEYEKEFEYKLNLIVKFLDTQNLIFSSSGKNFLIKHKQNSKINTQYEVFDNNNKHVTYITVKELLGEYDLAIAEKKYNQVKSLYTIKPSNNIMLDINFYQNFYIGFLDGVDIFFGTGLSLVPRYNLKGIKPVIDFEIIYNYKNYPLMYNANIGLMYDIILDKGLRLNFLVKTGPIVLQNSLSHISLNIYLNLEYMILRYMSINIGAGFSYYFFVNKYQNEYKDIGSIPINLGLSFKL